MTRKFNVYKIFHVIDDEWPRIIRCRVVSCPGPDLNIGQGAVEVKDLNDKGKDKTWEMNDLYSPVSPPPDCARYEKQYPEEMNQDNGICKKSVKDTLSPLS